MAGNPTTEQIDERILRLLGLENEYELSYEEYVRNLKEAMVASRMSKSKFSTEESESFTNEWKRVRSKKGRFKPKKKKITAEGLGIGKGFTNPLKITQQKFLPPQTSKDTTSLVSSLLKPVDKEVKNDGDNVFLRISKTLDSILQTLIDANKESKKKFEKERIDAEGRARSEKEKALESRPFEKIKKAFDIITKPFQSIWDIFANFIKNVILGKIVVKLLDWFGDSKNKGKVKSLTRFLVDFGPALLAAFILFGTRFGGAVRFLSAIAIKGILRLSKFAIPKILRFITRNPIAAGIALVTAGATVPAMFPGTVNAQERKTDKAPGTKEDKIKALEKQKANLNVFEKIQGKGGEIDEQLFYLKTGKTKSYGFVGEDNKEQQTPKVEGRSGGGLIKIPNLAGGDESNKEQQTPKVEGRSGGGLIKIPNLAGGGGVNFKGMMRGAFSGGLSKFNKGKMFGELGVSPISTLPKSKKQKQKQKPNVFVSDDEGLVKGKKGVDKVPAMLSDGEIVFSVPAVNYWGADKLLAMNKEGGGTNKPKMISGVPHAAGGGQIGDIPLSTTYGANPNDNTLRQAARMFSQNGKFGVEEDLFKTFKKLGGVADFEKMVGGKQNFQKINMGLAGADDALDAIRMSAIEKLKAVNNPQSFTQSSRAAAGLDDLAKKYDYDMKTNPMRGYADNISKLNTPKPRTSTTPANRMVPNAAESAAESVANRVRTSTTPANRMVPNAAESAANRVRTSTTPANRMVPNAGESSANAMRAAERAASRVRSPIPASRAIVPYTGGGLARTGVTGGISNLPGIKTNLRVPGGFGNIKSLGAELLLNYLVDKGFDYMDAKRVADQVEKGKKASPEKRDADIEKLRNLVDKEERWQRGGGGLYDKIIGLGKESDSERISKNARAVLSGLGANTYQGGNIMGGYGLKQQSFKDMPKTQIMTDDKGKPFVGYKAMRGGKPVYVRGPQMMPWKGSPFAESSNPLEVLGRAINPNAYKQIDAINQRKKYQQASAGSIASLKARGASQETIARRQAELKKSATITRKTTPTPIKPPTQPRVRFVNLNQGGARNKSQLVGGGAPKAPSFSPNHGRTNTAAKTLGVNRK